MILKQISPHATGNGMMKDRAYFCQNIDLKDKKQVVEDLIKFFDHLKDDRYYADSTLCTCGLFLDQSQNATLSKGEQVLKSNPFLNSSSMVKLVYCYVHKKL